MKMRWAKMTAVSIKVRVAGREPGLKRARKIVNNRKWFPKGKIGGQPTPAALLCPAPLPCPLVPGSIPPAQCSGS